MWIPLSIVLYFVTLHNILHVDPWVKWGPSKFYFLKDFAKIPHSIVLDHQADTNKLCSKHDQQHSNWLYALVFSLMTVELCDFDNPTYSEIFSSQQGRIALTKLALDKIFYVL